jgi:GT2 family glycosyltransferase
MHKQVAIILLNWNTPVHTVNCIASLKDYCNEALFDIIVADNGSSDGSLSHLQLKYPDLVFIDNKENLGFAEGNNVALRYSMNHNYTFSLVLNTDTVVDEDIVKKLTSHLDANLNAAAVQPAIYWLHNKTQIWNGKGKFDKFLGKTVSITTKPDQPESAGYEIADWLTGCCMLIRNSALLKSGLFNQKFFLYFEDVDLSIRLSKAGFQLHYLPSCKMYHEAGVSAKAVPQKEGSLSPVIHYYTSRNHLWILRRYGSPICYPINTIYNGLYYLSLLAYLTLRGRFKKCNQLIKGLKHGIFTPKDLIWPVNH